MHILQKVRGPLLFTYSSKKSKHEWIRFLPKPQKRHFWDLLTDQDFFQKCSSITCLLYECITLHKTSEKTDEQFLTFFVAKG